MMIDNFAFWVSIAVAIVVVIVILKIAVVVPQQSAYVIESLGKYSRTLRAGFHILIPFVENALTNIASRNLRLISPSKSVLPMIMFRSVSMECSIFRSWMQSARPTVLLILLLRFHS